jgi:hypothetical protein
MRRKTMKQKVFTNTHFESRDGMLTTVWGPGMWHYLHTMSFNYPTKPTCLDKAHYRDFILQLKYVLPCGKCRENLCKTFKKMPLTMRHMASRATFSKYIYDLHEIVNKMLNKRSGLRYEDVRERYENFRARCSAARHTKRKKENTEKGCTEPLIGEKAKCILKIVPDNTKCDTLEIDEKCIKKRVSL